MKQVRDIAQAVLRALAAAHDAGVVHRDVKPANVLLAENGQVLLADFGISVAQADTRMTQYAHVIGSPGFIAPERLCGERGDGRSDLFSLGVTLYAAVEGALPFPVENPIATVTEQPAPPVKAKGKMGALITHLLEKDPANRPTISEALAMLAEAPKPKVAPPAAPKKQPTARLKPVTVTNSASELIKKYGDEYSDATGGFLAGWGCLPTILLAVLGMWCLRKSGNDLDTGDMIFGSLAVEFGIIAVVMGIGCGVGWLAGLFAASDTVTLDHEGIRFSRDANGGRPELGFSVTWQTLEHITVQNGVVVAWFKNGSVPAPELRSANGIHPHQAGGYSLYDVTYSHSSVHPKRFNKPLKEFAGARYGRPKGTQA